MRERRHSACNAIISNHLCPIPITFEIVRPRSTINKLQPICSKILSFGTQWPTQKTSRHVAGSLTSPGFPCRRPDRGPRRTAVPPLRGCHWVAKDSILLQMGCSLLRTGRTRSNNFETGWDRAQFVGNDRIAGNATPFTHRSMAQW